MTALKATADHQGGHTPNAVTGYGCQSDAMASTIMPSFRESQTCRTAPIANQLKDHGYGQGRNPFRHMNSAQSRQVIGHSCNNANVYQR